MGLTELFWLSMLAALCALPSMIQILRANRKGKK